MASQFPTSDSLEKHGIKNTGFVYWNLSTPLLYEEAIRRREGRMAHLGPLVVRTGEHTGRSPNDKFVVREPSSKDKVWWGPVNKAMETERFASLQNRLLAYLQGKDLFIQDCFAGADPAYFLPIRVITETAWHSLFARNMFIQSIQAKVEELAGHSPKFTVINAPNFRRGSRSGRYSFRGLHRHPFRPEAGAHRRHPVCRGDQKVHLHRHELPPAPKTGAVHALFG